MRKASFFNNFSLSHSSLSEWIEIHIHVRQGSDSNCLTLH